jgi:predicted lipopolysaccharide heptosyltransferase III
VKILLVRLRLIGDVVFTTPLLGALRRRFPDAELTYVVEQAADPVVRGNPHLTHIIVTPKRAGLARIMDDLALARRLRRERFDIAIDLHGGPRGAWLTWASGAPMRIGYTTPGRSWMYTHAVARPADLSGQHSVLKQWELLTPLDVGAADPARDPVDMPADAAAAARVDAMLRRAGVDESHPIVVMHVSAGNPFRRWPLEHFGTVVSELARRDPRRRFILTSGPSEADAARLLVERIRTAAPDAAAAVVRGELDIAELRAAVARASLYIGGDSGPLHVAATTHTPIVALFGPTLAERSMPWRDAKWFAEAVDAGPLPCRPCRQRHCEPGDFRCLTRIGPERVIAAAERGLERATMTDGVRPLRTARA